MGRSSGDSNTKVFLTFSRFQHRNFVKTFLEKSWSSIVLCMGESEKAPFTCEMMVNISK